MFYLYFDVLMRCYVSVKLSAICRKRSDLRLFFQGDVDKDGYLDYGEFVAISVHLRKMGNDEHLHKAFQFFDQNQTGYIELEELRDALADEVDTSEEVVTAIMHDVDTDKVCQFPLINKNLYTNICIGKY